MQYQQQSIKQPEAKLKPYSWLDVDQELWNALDLCSDDDLENLQQVLQKVSLFSPLLKSLVIDKEKSQISYQGRTSLMYRIDRAFRFLAANQTEVIRGERPTYRESLLCVKRNFSIQCPTQLSTQDLELEIYLFMLGNYREFTGDISSSQKEIQSAISQGDGMLAQHNVLNLQRSLQKKTVLSALSKTIASPIKFGIKEFRSSAVYMVTAVSTHILKQQVLRSMANQILMNSNELEKLSRIARSTTISKQYKQKLIFKATQKTLKGISSYGYVNGAFNCIGPILWLWTFIDLGSKSFGTDYARILKFICTLAQIRLLATYGWTEKGLDENTRVHRSQLNNIWG